MLDLPEKDYVVDKISQNYDSSEFIKNIFSYLKNNFEEEEIYRYFSGIYDELFTDLILKKTFVSNETKKMLEILSTPIYKKSEDEKQKLYKKFL